MKFFLSLLCLLGLAATALAGIPGVDVAGTLGGQVGLDADDDEGKFHAYKPDDDPYDINAIDEEKLGTLGKLATGLTDLVRGIVKGLEPSVTSLYAVIIPTVRIVLAGLKIKVCRPQSRVEIIVWFVKELVNVQLNADLGVAQIPLCTKREEPASLKKWNITYEVPDQYEKGDANPAGLSDAGLGGAPAPDSSVDPADAAGEPAAGEPAGDEPAAEEPAGDEPAAGEPDK